MGFSRQEYWGGLPHPPPRDGPNPGIKPASLLSPALTGRFFTTSATWKALINGNHLFNVFTWPEARERKRLHQLWCFFLFLQGNQSYQIRVPILWLHPTLIIPLEALSPNTVMWRVVQFSSVQSLSRVRIFVTSWTAAHQASPSITNSRSLPKPTSIESVMPSTHLILCPPLLLLPSTFPSIRVFSNESVLCISGQSIGVSASASVLPINTQDWSPLGWTGWISLQSKGLSRVFSNTTVQKHQFFGTQLSL